MKLFISVLIGVVFANTVFANGLAGTWRGESICTVKDSPCHDEKVVYTITEPEPGRVRIQAYKIVNGKPDDMGTISCTTDSTSTKLTCPIPRAEFQFVVTGSKMTGTLTLTDGTLYRRISVTKE